MAQVTRRLRFEVLRRDGHTCRYCGASAPDAKLTVDHVVAVALGGTDDPTNLVTACSPCNAGKASTNPDAPVVADVARDDLRWAAAMAAAASAWIDQREEFDYYIGDVGDRWCQWVAGDTGENFPRPSDWRSQVDTWLRLGVDPRALTYYVDVALARTGVHFEERWRYFCGCVWRHVTELQAQAKARIMAEGDDDGAI